MACTLQDIKVLWHHQCKHVANNRRDITRLNNCVPVRQCIVEKINAILHGSLWCGIMYPQTVITDPYLAITKHSKVWKVCALLCINFKMRVWFQESMTKSNVCECMWILVYALVGKSGWRCVLCLYLMILFPYKMFDTLSTKMQIEAVNL